MISLIFAMGKDYLIGKDNLIPWHYKEDFLYFKKTTLNKKCVMGLNTFKSILSYNNQPLKSRTNIVCSLDDFKYDGVIVINDLIKFLKENKDSDEEIFIIGGKQIYELSLPYANKIYITWILKKYEGNVYFDKLDLKDFSLISSNKSGDLDFSIYERMRKI